MSAIQARQEEHPLPETELIQCIWTGLLNSVEWSARPDQHEGLAVKEVTVRVPPLRSSLLGLNYAVAFFSLPEIRRSSRTVLQQPEDGGNAHQRGAGVLLRRYQGYESVSSATEGLVPLCGDSKSLSAHDL